MTRVRLNLVTQCCVLVIAVACGSSNKAEAPGTANTATVGGQVSASVGGNGSANGGNNSAAGALGDGGGNTSTVSLSGTGASGNTTDGDNGDSVGGASNNGGGAPNALGGALTVDVKITGGTGSSADVTTGGNGSSVDLATGGSWTIDKATGGGRSLDVATGGGNSLDKATGGGSSVDLSTGGGTSIDVPSCIKTDLNNVNVYVITDVTNMSTTASDCEGNMYVGGNFYSAVGYSIGGKNLVTGDACTQYSFVDAGNVSGAMVNNGKAAVAGTVANSQAVCGGFPRMAKSQLPVDFATLSAKFQKLSTALAQLPTTAGATVTRDAGGALVLKGTDTVQNVFNIDASQIGTLTLNVPLTSVVIINVTGTDISWPGGSMKLPGATGGVNGDYVFSSNVIWNFPEATQFTMNGLAIHGTVLAPFATFDASGSGHVAGQVIVYAMTGLAIEFHPYYFSACITWPKTN